MKKITLTSALLAASIASAFSVQAANDRYIIQVDNNKKGIIKALAKQAGAKIEVESDGFFAATFTGSSRKT